MAETKDETKEKPRTNKGQLATWGVVVIVIVCWIVLTPSGRFGQAAENAGPPVRRQLPPLSDEPHSVQFIATTSWHSIRGTVPGYARDITPDEDDVEWEVMLNDNPDLIKHMPPRNTKTPKHVEVKDPPPKITSVKVRVAPGQACTSCQFSYDWLPL